MSHQVFRGIAKSYDQWVLPVSDGGSFVFYRLQRLMLDDSLDIFSHTRRQLGLQLHILTRPAPATIEQLIRRRH